MNTFRFTRLLKYSLATALFFLTLNLMAVAQAGKYQKPIEKSSISFRIGLGQSLSEKRFTALLDLFDKYENVTDEITFFTSSTHPPLPLDIFKDRMTVLKDRMKQARKRGYRTGINILSTIGHHNENLENSLHGDYTNVTDIEGNVSKGSYCPNDKKLQAYIRELYIAIALADPDYIWLDDDIRLAGHMPVYLTCFCNNCMEIFSGESGVRYDRESFKLAVNEGTVEQKIELRSAWLQHNRNTIAHLFKLIEETVHKLRPTIPLGFMTGDRFFEGYDFDNWKKVLSGPDSIQVLWRPGGGFYNDNSPGELAGKSHDIGRQVSMLPDDVVCIQSEIENFPYQRLKKSAVIVALEAASHIAAGCTGAAFNVLSFYDEPLDEYEPLLAKLKATRPFFDLMTQTLGRSKLSGTSVLWNKNSFNTINVEDGSWFNGGRIIPNPEVYEIGLPASYAPKAAAVVMVDKNNMYALTKKEIIELLSGSVYMSAEALEQLNKMGYADLTGFKVIHSSSADQIEKFTAHVLNGRFAGCERDNRQSFYPTPAYTLQATDSKAQTLARLINYSGKESGAITMGIFENRLGGRICVAGYYPWNFMGSLSKSAQMKSVFRWLSREKMPGYIESFHKINLWIREPQDGKIALAFSNSSFDPAVNVTLLLKTNKTTLKLYDMTNKKITITSKGKDGPYQRFVIPYVDPWQMRLMTSE